MKVDQNIQLGYPHRRYTHARHLASARHFVTLSASLVKQACYRSHARHFVTPSASLVKQACYRSVILTLLPLVTA